MKRGKVTLRNILGYVFPSSSYASKHKEAECLEVPGSKRLIVKIGPTPDTINQQNSREAGEQLFGIIHHSLAMGVYDVLEERVVANFFRHYQPNELEAMKRMIETWKNPFDHLGYRTPDFYEIISNVINSLEKKAQANPSGEKKYHDLSCGETEKRVHSVLHGGGKASFDRLQEESESDNPLEERGL